MCRPIPALCRQFYMITVQHVLKTSSSEEACTSHCARHTGSWPPIKTLILSLNVSVAAT